MISSSDIHGAKVLIVDDQQANVLLLDRTLRGAGYVSITSTMNPLEVCELHRKNRYDLILLDLEMPGMDGFQVMDALKQIENDGYLSVLVVTAQPEHKIRALNAGAKDFLSKPLDLAEVLTRVYNMLEVRLLHMETRRLYDEVVAEQEVSARLLRRVLPRSVAARFKTDLSIAELLRLSNVEPAGADADPKERHRRAAERTGHQVVMLILAAVFIGLASWWGLRTLPVWGRLLGSTTCGAAVAALFYVWNRRFVDGEMQGEAKMRSALDAQRAGAAASP